MAQSVTKGYTFGSTELVTAAKLHSLVDSATLITSYHTTFTLGSIVTSNLTIVHGLGSKFVNPVIWDSSDVRIPDDYITCQALNTTTLVLDMGSYPSLASVCNVRVFL
jgi:L-rhamnose isomerase